MSDRVLSNGAIGSDVQEVQTLLEELGLGPIMGEVDGDYGTDTMTAIMRFQEMFAWYAIEIDGVCGPSTWGALRYAHESGGRISEHFRPHEFASPDSGEVRVLRGLVEGLERLRDLTGEPLPIVSGFRSVGHNASVGGVRRSLHLVGAAADIPAVVALKAVVKLRCFSGVGYREADDLVIHVDVRHLSEWPDGSSPEDPAVFAE
jgi:zinc D-Ala-D-Ala carboxypeptidase